MSSKKIFYILLGILGIVVLGAVAGTLYGTNMLKKTGNTLYERKLDEAVLEKEEEALKQAKRDIAEYGELESIAKAIVPQEKDQARTVREITKIASASGISISKIKFPDSTLGEKPKSAKGSKQPVAPSGTTQLETVEGLKNVYAMPIEIESDSTGYITYGQLLDFLKRLENNRRTSHVTSVSIQTDKRDAKRITFTLTINAYIKP